jgi:hypothetical protein
MYSLLLQQAGIDRHLAQALAGAAKTALAIAGAMPTFSSIYKSSL